MQSMLQKVWVVVVAVLLLSVSAGCVKPPTVKLHDIDVVGIDFRKIDLVFALKVTNPNNFQLDFSSLTYGLASDGTEIVKGALASPVMSLSANETTIVRAPISLEYAALAPMLRNIRAGETIPYQFSTAAEFLFLDLLKIPVHLKRSGRMPALRKPAWHFRDVRLVKGPPSWLELSFEVENPNIFELPLEKLSGVLKYGNEIILRIDEPNLKPIPPGKTAMFTIRTRADGSGVTKAFARSIISRRRQRFAFEGSLRVGVPKLLRKMLLEELPKDD